MPISSTPATGDPDRTVTWRRLSSPVAAAALVALTLGAVGTSAGAVVAGRLAEHVTWSLVGWFAACVVGGAVLDTVGRFLWAGVADRAEGRLREDLLDAALGQPLPALSEQAVGEVLDRVDDDTREVGSLVRLQVWMMLRALVSIVPMLVVAGWTWGPALVAFPLFAVVALWSIRGLLGPIAERKVVEEAAWTDHAAVLEEGIAGRDDLRTSLGQAFAVKRLAGLSAEVHRRFVDVLVLERAVTLRTGLVLHGLLAVVAAIGVTLTVTGGLSLAQLVTLFLITATFVGSIGRVAEQLPDLQAGLGAIVRLRQMLGVEPEPVGGAHLPDGAVGLEFRHTSFAYAEGAFALQGVDLAVPAGATLALVGRTGSGKSTLASLVSRAVEPRPGEVFLGGVDVRDLDLQALRQSVGVVTQRTEILAGSLAQNITLFADVPTGRVEAVVDELGLTDWVAGLDEGLDTLLGPGGTTLSAGEEQLLAFARLLMRDVQVVVLDEATARMDPLTEARVVAASDRLLRDRTGILIAHRLSTIARADLVAVLADGRVLQAGPRAELAASPGAYRDLLDAAEVTPDAPFDAVTRDEADAPDAEVDIDAERAVPVDAPDATPAATGGRPPAVAAAVPGSDPAEATGAETGPEAAPVPVTALGTARRRGEVPEVRDPGDGPSLARGVVNALRVRPSWGLVAVALFLVFSLSGAMGGLTGYTWGHTVESLERGETPWVWLVATVVAILLGPVALSAAVVRYPRWWVEVLLRVRMAVLRGQTDQRRLPKVPPGEVVARAMDADRFARYADRWVDFTNGLLIAAFTALAARTWLAGLVLLVVMVASAGASAVGRPVAGRSAARASAARARFGRVLVSTLESARTVKLAGRTAEIRRHLRAVDGGRVEAAVREHRVQALLDGVPTVMVQAGAVAAWAAVLTGQWGLATALLVVSTVGGFDWFGRVAGAVVTEAPGTRAWQVATSRMAGGVDLVDLAPGIDLLTGEAPEPPPVPRVPLERVSMRGLSAMHEDGTIGVEDVDLDIDRGDLVLLVGQVGAGKSSLLRALAGLTDHLGELRWNGTDVDDPELFLRPGQVAYVAQVPRVLSGTFADNVQLGHDRPFGDPVSDARLDPDVEQAGGAHSLVGHRGVRLSGGQVQRLALARALAADAELLLADDVSSALDARTEIELWRALRARSTTVVGASSKRAALAQADRVVVLVEGRVAAVGPWTELSQRWGHLAG
ncbi:ATP-binding cassette domain-containing protein [Mobilicoccus pelagius]|uniref:Putative ABC transporter permease/ATP-binding protein n=1 Tax=Mobilicoccus pelagius NBRC 104925 TaxID=1089455 RepID=H5UV36_9MICO|nr:putative ABC transporter permease/ATP-binding protein [Mobilicoccus pelagius NBRC 104925]